MWKNYEEKLYQFLLENYPSNDIIYNDLIFGLYSKTERQIDIALRGNVAGSKVLGIIDCKYYSKKINLKVVESFIGMMQDVNANFGVMMTNIGYTPAAKNRARNSSLKLEILETNNFNDVEVTIDYFFNKNIQGLQLSKYEFFKRCKANSGYFDESKSDYKRRIVFFKEGFAVSQYFAYKKSLENTARCFRDFPQTSTVTTYIPSNNDNEIKHLFKCEITRTQLENFLQKNMEELRDDISLWRADFLATLTKNVVLKFAHDFITSQPYLSYEDINV